MPLQGGLRRRGRGWAVELVVSFRWVGGWESETNGVKPKRLMV